MVFGRAIRAAFRKENRSMRKFAIYTAIIGGYDEVQQPMVLDNRFDYILFSDSIEDEKVGVWQVRRIDYKNDVQVKIARYVKTHPHTLLSEYEATLWIDASVLIKSDYVYQRVVDLYDKGVLLASHIHPLRDCIYDEMFTVMEHQFESEEIILNWGHVLRKNHYPLHNGLCETRVMYRKQDARIQELNEKWWNCIERYSRRDQLSFNYVLYSLHLPFVSFLPEGVSVRDSEYFQIKEHYNESAKQYAISTDSWLLKYYRKHPALEKKIKQTYYKIYRTSNPKLWARIFGQVYRVKELLAKRL